MMYLIVTMPQLIILCFLMGKQVKQVLFFLMWKANLLPGSRLTLYVCVSIWIYTYMLYWLYPCEKVKWLSFSKNNLFFSMNKAINEPGLNLGLILHVIKIGTVFSFVWDSHTLCWKITEGKSYLKFNNYVGLEIVTLEKSQTTGFCKASWFFIIKTV